MHEVNVAIEPEISASLGRYPGGLLAPRVDRVHNPENGEVQGYCFGTGNYGTVQPLRLKGLKGRLGAVWARFVLLSSILLFFRFGTLLTRNSMARLIARK